MKTSLKVAYVATVYRHLEAFHVPFIELLMQIGYEVHAYANLDNGKDSLVKLGVHCHDIDFDRSPVKLTNLCALRQLTESLRHERFNMIHVHTPVGGVIGRIAGKVSGVPAVLYTAHGFHFFKGSSWVNWIFYYPIERMLARWTDYLITINREDFQIAQKFPVRKKVFYIPGVGVNTQMFAPMDSSSLREQYGLHENDFVIACVAELIPRKNHRQLIESVKELVKSGVPVKCLLVGDGSYQNYLTEKVKNDGLQENIIFLGFRRDVVSILNVSDVVALLSRHEGLPVALLEAMAVGKPIITTDVRGNRDLILDGYTGKIVPLNDIRGTTEALMALYSNPDLRVRMGEVNRERVKAYELRNIVEKMRYVYEEATQTL